jgi:predicted permease
MAMWVDGWTADPNKLDVFEVRHVSPEFFRVMGIPLRAGRGFTPDDRAGGPPVVIVSETAVRRFWSGRNPIGGRIRYPWPGWMEVVGVVADVRNNDLAEDPAPAVYLPVAQEAVGPSGGPPTVVARASGDPALALAAIRRAVANAAPDVPVSEEQTVERLIERSVAAPRAASRLLLGFGALALLLGAVGTYGLVAYGVQQRSREIAVRIAVGASRGRVVGLVLREGARLAGLGIVAGLVGALALSRLMRGLLYGIDPVDPIAFTVAPAVLGLTALLACLAPALRAARIAPSTALR